MDKIKYIIDFDGFDLSMGFLIKEACVLNVVEKTIKSYFFNLGDFASLGPADRRQAKWLTRHLHGLLFSRDLSPTDLPSQADFTPILREIIDDCHESGSCIAYKGGIYERDIIKSIDGSSNIIDLETYGCPTAEELLSAEDKKINLNCNRHIRKTSHCPKLECFLYYKWITVQLYGPSTTPTIFSEHF